MIEITRWGRVGDQKSGVGNKTKARGAEWRGESGKRSSGEEAREEAVTRTSGEWDQRW